MAGFLLIQRDLQIKRGKVVVGRIRLSYSQKVVYECNKVGNWTQWVNLKAECQIENPRKYEVLPIGALVKKAVAANRDLRVALTMVRDELDAIKHMWEQLSTAKAG